MHIAAVTHLPCSFPSIQVLFFKKTQTKRHTLLIFKSESFPPPNLSSSTDKSTMYSFSYYNAFFFLFIPSKLFPPKLPLL